MNRKFIFLHGLGCDPDNYLDIIERMDIRTDEFLNWGMPKHYDKFGSNIKGISVLTECIRILEEYCASYDQEFHIVCHSLGSSIGIPLARTLEDKLQSITIFEGNLIGSDCGLISRGISGCHTTEELNKFVYDIGKQYGGYWLNWVKSATKYEAQLLIKYASELCDVSSSEQLLEQFSNLKISKKYIYGDEYKGSETVSRVEKANRYHMQAVDHFMILDDPSNCAELILKNADRYVDF